MSLHLGPRSAAAGLRGMRDLPSLRAPSRGLSHARQSRPRLPPSFPSPLALGLRPTHRTFITSTLTSVSEAVGATPLPGLLAASPLPLWGSVLALALTVRGAITFPLQLWQRRRVWRARKFVVPEMKRINEELAVQLAVKSKKEGLTYDEYRKRLKDELATRQAALHKEHGTHPTTTLLVPLAVSIPLFICMSMTIRQAVTMYPELAAQSFGWIEHMGLPDKQWILPMMAGLLGFGNAEHASARFDARKEASEASEAAAPASPPPSSSSSSGRPKGTRKFSTSAPALAGPQHFGKRRVAAKPRAVSQIPGAPPSPSQPQPVKVKGGVKRPGAADMVEETHWAAKLVPQNREWIQKALTMTLRGASFLVIVVGLQMPAAVVWYWTCSMTFTLLQNVYFDRADKLERAEIDALKRA